MLTLRRTGHSSVRLALGLLVATGLLGCSHSAAVAAPEAPSVSSSPEAVTVSLPNNTSLRFAVRDGLLLGLQSASVDGVELTSDETVFRPVLAQEWKDIHPGGRRIFSLMRFEQAKVQQGAVVLTARLLACPDEAAYREFYVYAADFAAARAEAGNEDSPLQALKQAHDRAQARLVEAVDQDPSLDKQKKRVQRYLGEAADSKKSQGARDWARTRAERARGRLRSARRKLFDVYAQKNDALRSHLDAVVAFEKALANRALEIGKIHRDHYRFAHTRLPADVARIEHLEAFIEAHGDRFTPAGTIRWVIQPDTRNIAGWRWAGWKQHFEFRLDDGRKVNNLRTLATWEIDGKVGDLTAVALRYRGLGRIEQTFQTDPAGRVRNAWSTPDIIPGAVGGAPLISPVVPVSKDVNDRGYAMQHRVQSWISKCARGAGQNFVDFQFRPHAILAAFHARQGNLRGLSEALPGDRFVSQSDEQWFALTSEHKTVPRSFLALVTRDDPLTRNESRTRYRELDQYVRDQVSQELGFVQYEPLPGIGLLYDAGWAGFFNKLAERDIARYAGQGVRMIAIHNPGWVNGRYQGPGGPPATGGGVCNIYDYLPTEDVKEPWKALTRTNAAEGVAWYVWLGQTTWKDAPLCKEIGYDKKHWSLNGPHDAHGPGYGGENLKGNIHDERFRKIFLARLDTVGQTYGYNGFWCDSFQNLFMSQLDWANPDPRKRGGSLQRAWWEQIAAWSRDRRAWMAESHAFPGMSCSIEVHHMFEDHWYFTHTWKWLRGNSQNDWDKQRWDETAYTFMAAKAWVAPDCSYNRPIPEKFAGTFTRYANEYLAALPMMRRSWILQGDRGTIWLGYGSNDQGVWFPFRDQDVPSGVKARPILANPGREIRKVQARHTYVIRGKDLPKLFGVRTGPLDDPRLGREYEMPAYNYPAWAQPDEQ